MTVMTSAGSTLSIATGLPATNDNTGFSALVYTAISEITSIGEVGKTFNIVNHSPLGNRGIQKLKGSYQNGSMAVAMAREVANVGQVALKAALASDAFYSFKIVLQDGSKVFFTGVVSAAKFNVGTVDQITGANCTIELGSSDFVEA